MHTTFLHFKSIEVEPCRFLFLKSNWLGSKQGLMTEGSHDGVSLERHGQG